MFDRLEAQLEALEFAAIEKAFVALAEQQGCAPTLQGAIVRLVRFIEAEEGRRGQIARAARSTLSANAERCQVILDKLILTLLGLGADRHGYIEARLEKML